MDVTPMRVGQVGRQPKSHLPPSSSSPHVTQTCLVFNCRAHGRRTSHPGCSRARLRHTFIAESASVRLNCPCPLPSNTGSPAPSQGRPCPDTLVEPSAEPLHLPCCPAPAARAQKESMAKSPSSHKDQGPGARQAGVIPARVLPGSSWVCKVGMSAALAEAGALGHLSPSLPPGVPEPWWVGSLVPHFPGSVGVPSLSPALPVPGGYGSTLRTLETVTDPDGWESDQRSCPCSCCPWPAVPNPESLTPPRSLAQGSGAQQQVGAGQRGGPGASSPRRA